MVVHKNVNNDTPKVEINVRLRRSIRPPSSGCANMAVVCENCSRTGILTHNIVIAGKGLKL